MNWNQWFPPSTSYLHVFHVSPISRGISECGSTITPFVPRKMLLRSGSFRFLHCVFRVLFRPVTNCRNLGGRALFSVIPGHGHGFPAVNSVPWIDVVNYGIRAHECAFGSSPSLRTEIGSQGQRLENGSNIWQPISPNVPVPKSSRFRQFSG